MKNDDVPFKGFLISCDKNKEKQALRDAYNFITDYIEQLYSDVTQEHIHKKIKQEGKEVTLETQVSYGRRKEVKLLTQVETHVNVKIYVMQCMCFIKINAAYSQIDPLRVVNAIMKDVHEEGRLVTRYCHRILPVQKAFRAQHFRMLDELDDLLNIHSQSKEIKSWMLNFKCRNNNKFNYKQVLKQTQKLAKKYSHFPDIYYPQWAISIEISNHLMCLSICQNFKETNQYKLHKKIDKSKQIQKKQQEVVQSIAHSFKRDLKRRRTDSESSIEKEEIDFLKDRMQPPRIKTERVERQQSRVFQGICVGKQKCDQKGLSEQQKGQLGQRQAILLVQKIEAQEDDVQLI